MGLKTSATHLVTQQTGLRGQFDKAEEAQYICVRIAKTTVSNFDFVKLDRI